MTNEWMGEKWESRKYLNFFLGRVVHILGLRVPGSCFGPCLGRSRRRKSSIIVKNNSWLDRMRMGNSDCAIKLLKHLFLKSSFWHEQERDI